jgi:hypothetical protein
MITPPKNCQNPIIAIHYPQGTEEFRVICGFTPKFDEFGNISTLTEAKVYIYASLIHGEAKQYYQTEVIGRQKTIFLCGTKVFDLYGEKAQGFANANVSCKGLGSGFPEGVSQGIVGFSLVSVSLLVILFLVQLIWKHERYRNMEIWQELLLAFVCVLLFLFYFLLVFVVIYLKLVKS